MLCGDDWGTDPLLGRAFSILAVDPSGRLDVLVKVVGKASRLLARAPLGASFSILGPLGTTFPAADDQRRDWLVAGGVGLAPLLMHAHAAAAAGAADRVTMFYGGRSTDDLVLTDEVATLGAELIVATEDGSRGQAGYVTAAVEAALAADAGHAPPTLMACGPEAMLVAVAALAHRHGLSAYLSLEGEMACGIGACLACAVPCSGSAFRYTCVHGPVFALTELAGRFAAPEQEAQ